MKVQKLFLPILILTLFFAGTMVQGQSQSEKEKEEKIIELEKKLQEALKQREAELEKALDASKKYQDEELRKILEDQKKVQKKAIEQYKKSREANPEFFERNWGDARDFYDQKHIEKLYGDQNYRIFHPDMDFDFDVEAFEDLGGVFLSASAKDRTALTISKDLDEVTFDTKFKYDVTEGARGVNFKINGSMHEGTLFIRIVKPGGEVLQEIEISPLADVSWSQDLRWDEDDEPEGKLGTWVIVVSAKEASGHYSVNVRAN